MFKRLRWLLFGALAGVSGSIWAQHRVKRAVGKVMPSRLGSEVRQRVERVGSDLKASLSDGRTAMAEREAELRARLPEGVTPLPGALPPLRGRTVIEAVEVGPSVGSGRRTRSGRHPSGAPPAGEEESTVTELSAARRSRLGAPRVDRPRRGGRRR